MKKRILTSLVLVGATIALSACTFKYTYVVPTYPFEDLLPDSDDDGGTYNIKVWCDKSILSLTQTQIKAFETLNNGKYVLNINAEPQSEGDAASALILDPENGADVYCFAQDQLSRLIIAGGLNEITGTHADAIKADNVEGSVKAATYNDTLYAYPMTNDNGYFMYYDKRVLSDTDILDMDKVIDKVSKAGKMINYKVFNNGFYSASYFMATGCYSHWTVDAESGNFTGYNDSYAQKGMPAMRALEKLKASGLVAPNDNTNKLGDTAAVAISGIWNYAAAVKALGDSLGCAPLPNFTDKDGKPYHISSFSGYKLIGVKQQTDAKKLSVCKKIAKYLSSEQCQLERFNLVGWGPSNKNVNNLEAVQTHPGLMALREQDEFSHEQEVCPSAWWDTLLTLASSVKAGQTDTDFEKNLAIYNANLPACLDD